MVKTVLGIEGMACSMCEAHINDAVRAAFKVKKVSSSHAKGRTEIISETPPNEAELRRVIDATGYKLLSVTAEPYEKKGLFGRR
ncbi:MAG: cation transporter [Clostridia bacterium]|nr:cation transporter [Clostridia bacterium]